MLGLIYGILYFIFRLIIIILVVNIVLNLSFFLISKFYISKNKNILQVVNYLLENLYIEDINLNDELSNKILFKFLKSLDDLDQIQYLTKEDVINIKSKYNNIIDDNLKNRNFKFSKEIFNIFKKRVNERNNEIKDMLEEVESTFLFEDEILNLKYEKREFKSDYENYWKSEEDRKYRLKKLIKFNYILYGDFKSINKKLINKKYKSFTDDQIFSLILNSYLYYLDPHTNYISSNLLNPVKTYGLGVTIKKNLFNEIIIDKVISGGAASKAGLERGDILISVTENNKEINLSNYSIDETASVILGENGTKMIIKVMKINGDIKNYDITRGPIDFNTSEILNIYGKKVGFIKFISFDQNSSEFVKKSLKDFNKIDGLVIDVRDNGGGLLTEVIKILDMFIDTGVAIKYLDQVDKQNEKYILSKMTESGKLYDGPLTILINSNSASASEVLAGVIQYYKRGLIVGTSQTTFGKGVMQSVIPLLNNKIFKFTSGSYHLPNGISPQFTGISSDVVIYNDIETRLKTDYGYEKFLPNVTKTSDVLPSKIKFDNSLNNLKDIKKYIFKDQKIIKEVNKYIEEYINLEKEINKLYENFPLNENKIAIQNDKIKSLELDKYKTLNIIQNIVIKKIYPKIDIKYKNYNENILPWFLSGLLTLQIK